MKPEFIELLAEGINLLEAQKTDFMHQLGGARNFGAGIVDCEFINSLYEERVFNREEGNTSAMNERDDQWAEGYRPAFVDALKERIKKGP